MQAPGRARSRVRRSSPGGEAEPRLCADVDLRALGVLMPGDLLLIGRPGALQGLDQLAVDHLARRLAERPVNQDLPKGLSAGGGARLNRHNATRIDPGRAVLRLVRRSWTWVGSRVRCGTFSLNP